MSDSDPEKSPVSVKRAREASFGDDGTIVDPKDQGNMITLLQEQHLQAGSMWYLISANWYKRWQRYCGRMASSEPNSRALGENSHPGPINNKTILENDQLKQDLVLDDSVFAIPTPAWNLLTEWYGLAPDTTPLERQVISTADDFTIELYPPQFRVYAIESNSIEDNITRTPIITLSQTNTYRDLMTAAKDAYDLPTDAQVQLWVLEELPLNTNTPTISVNLLSKSTALEIEDEDATLSLSGLYNVAIELKQDDKYPSEMIHHDASSVSSTSSVFANGFNNLTTVTPPRFTRGVCGLQNLGNTCFMNSALQCLSNTPQLTKYFLADLFKKDLNPDNPLGMKGQVAEAFGELISKLWSGEVGSVAPRDFKYTIGRFNQSFSGYQQHDTQELLAFLLDGLHEDLNRIIKKPYIELPDFDGMKDQEIASRSWDYHRARNDSVIVDLFQGQFKSKLVCEECKNVSVTFDPFMYLSLPLPIKKQSKTTVVYVPYDPSERMKRVVVTLSKEGSIAHLQKEVAKMMSVQDPNSLLVVELFNHKVYKVFPQYEPVATIGSTDVVYVYQLPGPVPPLPKRKKYSYSRYSSNHDDEEEQPPVDENQLVVFPVYCAIKGKSESTYTHSESVTQFGDPIVLAMTNKEASQPELLYKLVSQHVERYTQFKLFEEVSEEVSVESEMVDSQLEEEDPPEYEMIMSEQEDVSTNPNEDQGYTFIEKAESPVGGEEEEEEGVMVPEADANMDDVKPIHTAAAVTAAGGKKTQPMSNLFTMKVFASRGYSRGSEELLPSVQSWSGLVDLQERAESEEKQRQAYHQQQEQVEEESSVDTEMEESIVLPSKMDDEDEVEDAASLFATPSASIEETITALPIVEAPPVLPKRKVTLPPSTIIRQGEGILLEWTVKKAQQLFGYNKNISSVCTDAWEDIEELGDPNVDTSDQQQKKQITLSDCMDEFTKEEELSEEDLWYCPKCKKHQRATKKFDLWRMPEIMVVHLKRFSHSRTWRDKIDALIDFPASELDLTDRVLSIEDHDDLPQEDRLIYDLYGVDNHYGGLGGGHYTAFAQNFEDKQWYNFDDSHVTKVDVTDVKTTAAYLLFYKRRRAEVATQSVEEIIAEAKEKQQAAQPIEELFQPQQTEAAYSSDQESDDDPHKVIGEDEPIIEFVQSSTTQDIDTD